MVKTQSSNFDAEWRDGNDSEMRCESLAGACPGMDGCLLRRPSSVGHGRSLPHSRLPVALQASEEGASPIVFFDVLKICIKKYSAKG